MAYDIGPRIGIDGEKEYRDQIKNITARMKELDSELKLNASEFEKSGKKQKDSENQTDILRQKIELQTEKLNENRRMMEQSISKTGELSTQTARYKEIVNDTERELAELQAEFAKSTNKAALLASGMETAGTKMRSAGEKISGIGSKLTTTLTLPIAGAAVASFKYASDLEENINKTDVAFRENSETVKKWSDTTLEKYGLAKSTALELAAQFGDMGTSMDIPLDTASEMSTTLVGLAADMASFKNISIDEARTGLNAVFTGETESLKKLGVVLTETNLKEFAAAEGIEKKYSEMTQAEKVMLRYQYVLDKTRNAQGDFARTSDGAANQMRITQESAKELAAEFGEELLPIGVELLKSVNGLLKGFSNLNPETKKAIVNAGLAFAAIGPVVSVVGKLTSGAGNAAVGISKLVKSFASVPAGGSSSVQFLTKLPALFSNPVGAALTLGGALLGIAGYMERVTGEGKNNAIMFRDAKKEIRDSAAAYEEVKDSIQGVLDSADEEADYYQNLLSELQLIVDENGKVKEGYEERATFITGALSETYGTEIEIVDGVIQKYGDLKKSMEDLMLQKRVTTAFEGIEESYQQTTELANNLSGTIADLKAQDADYQRQIDELKGKMVNTNPDDDLYSDYAKQLDGLYKVQAQVTDAISTSTEQLSGYETVIRSYEKAYAYMQQGNYKEAQKAIDDIAKAQKNGFVTEEGRLAAENVVRKKYLDEHKKDVMTTEDAITAYMAQEAAKRKGIYAGEAEEAEISAARILRAMTSNGKWNSGNQGGIRPSNYGTTYNQNITINSPTALSPYEVARQTRNQQQTLIRGIS